MRQLLAAGVTFLVCSAAGAATIRSPATRWLGYDDGAVAWAPDGRTMLVRRVSSPPKEPGDYRFALLTADGSGLVALSRPQSREEVWDSAAAFSPDGKHLLVTRELGLETNAVYVKDVATGSERRLTPAAAEEIGGNWSPDGVRVVVVRGLGADVLGGGAYKDRVFAADGTRDVIRCGSDIDSVVADRFDAVARDCERVTRR